MENYKSSKYNIVVSENNDAVTLWNSFNGAIIQLEKSVFEKINNDFFGNDVPYFKELYEMGLIVESNKNEYEIIKEKEIEIIEKENENLSIVITPTLKCNYKCVYCFEAHKEKKKAMDVATADKIIDYVKSKCETGKIKNMAITWFGGEPLLCYDLMLYTGERIKQIAEEHNVNYLSRIITNGSLLNEEKVNVLIEKINLKLLQITLDGLEDIYIEKKGTTRQCYKTVIENICNLCDKVRIKVRINADKSNYNDLLELCNFLLIEKNLKGKIDIYFAELKNYRIVLTNEKPIINWPSIKGHFIYYRKDIWELADLVTNWNGFTFKEYKVDNRGKFLYIYFNHPHGLKSFIAVGYQDIESMRHYLSQHDAKGLRLKAKAWGENLNF